MPYDGQTMLLGVAFSVVLRVAVSAAQPAPKLRSGSVQRSFSAGPRVLPRVFLPRVGNALG